MSDFTEDTLRYLEKIAFIQCDPEEEKALTKSLQKILDYVETLNDVPTKDVPEFCDSNLFMSKSVLREDEDERILSRDTYLENMSEKTAGMIRVPSVLPPKEKS